jgi:uncharacterized protein YceK
LTTTTLVTEGTQFVVNKYVASEGEEEGEEATQRQSAKKNNRWGCRAGPRDALHRLQPVIDDRLHRLAPKCNRSGDSFLWRMFAILLKNSFKKNILS